MLMRTIAAAALIARSPAFTGSEIGQLDPLRLRPGARTSSLLQQCPPRRDNEPCRLGHSPLPRSQNRQAQPGLATSWKWVDDQTLDELRQGVKFHNGEDFDADDVVYANFASARQWATAQQNVGWIGGKVDQFTVRIRTDARSGGDRISPGPSMHE